jgi:hypothetical protein
MVLAGMGLGLVVVPLVDVTLAEVVVRDAGAASGVLNTTRQLGQAFGVAVVGVVFFGILDDGPATLELAASAFGSSVWLAVGLFALSFFASFLLPPRAVEPELANASSQADPEALGRPVGSATGSYSHGRFQRTAPMTSHAPDRSR